MRQAKRKLKKAHIKLFCKHCGQKIYKRGFDEITLKQRYCCTNSECPKKVNYGSGQAIVLLFQADSYRRFVTHALP